MAIPPLSEPCAGRRKVSGGSKPGRAGGVIPSCEVLYSSPPDAEDMRLLYSAGALKLQVGSCACRMAERDWTQAHDPSDESVHASESPSDFPDFFLLLR